MNIKELPQKAKDFVLVKKEQFGTLSKKKKIAIVVAIISLILAIVFGISYSRANKYGVLFSGLESSDAAAVTKELESKKVDTKKEIVY